jgi:hypothetical protein
MVTFIDLYLGTTENPETGEKVERLWTKLSDGTELKLNNSIEEVQALGSKVNALSKMKIVDGQYGKFAKLSNVVKSTTDLFAKSEVKNETSGGAEGSATAKKATAKA